MLLALAFPLCLLHYLFECEQLPSMSVCRMDSSSFVKCVSCPACMRTNTACRSGMAKTVLEVLSSENITIQHHRSYNPQRRSYVCSGKKRGRKTQNGRCPLPHVRLWLRPFAFIYTRRHACAKLLARSNS